MSDELGKGQIIPAAQPVDVFVRPGQRNAAGVSAPPPLPAPAGIVTVGQAGTGSVQGFNAFEQLQAALAPFIQGGGFSSLATTATNLYAGGEYEKGRNEAIRAQVLANQQRERSAADFSALTRETEKVDPIGALMLDRANPYRMAGRQNQVSRLAAQDAPGFILNAYLNNPEAPTWPEGDARLTELRARATQSLLRKWSLDESSPGFHDYVAGEINKTWDEVTTRHKSDRVQWMDSTIPRMTALEMLGTYKNLRDAGVVRWAERGSDGKLVMREAALGSADFGRGVASHMGDILEQMARTSGIGGRAAGYTKEILGQLLELSNTGLNPEEQQSALDAFQILLRNTPGGALGPNGERPTLGSLYPDLFIGAAQKRIEQDFAAQKRAEQQALDAWEDSATIVSMMDPGPEKEAAKQRLFETGQGAGLGAAEMTESYDRLGRSTQQIAERDANSDQADAVLNEMRSLLPSETVRQMPQLRQMFRDSIAHLPAGVQQEKLKEFSQLEGRARQQVDSGIGAALPPNFNAVLGEQVRAVLELAYPKTFAQAIGRGVRDVQGWMTFNDANFAAATARVSSSMRQHMVNRLVEARQKAAGKLDPAQELEVITRAANEFASTKDEGMRRRMLPGGIGGGPGLNGGRVESPGRPQAAGPPPPPGRRWAPGATVGRDGLDALPQEALEQGQFTLERQAVVEEIQRVGNGGQPSSAVKRAARAAGQSLSDFLVEQARRYPGLLNPAAERELRRRANSFEGASRRVESTPQSSWLAGAGWFLDALLGTRPAMAANGGGRDGSVPFIRGGA